MHDSCDARKRSNCEKIAKSFTELCHCVRDVSVRILGYSGAFIANKTQISVVCVGAFRVTRGTEVQWPCPDNLLRWGHTSWTAASLPDTKSFEAPLRRSTQDQELPLPTLCCILHTPHCIPWYNLEIWQVQFDLVPFLRRSSHIEEPSTSPSSGARLPAIGEPRADAAHGAGGQVEICGPSDRTFTVDTIGHFFEFY